MNCTSSHDETATPMYCSLVKMYYHFFIICLLPSLCLLQADYNVVTDPEKEAGQEKIIVISELEENATILCSITAKGGNGVLQPVQSSWTLRQVSSGINTVLSTFDNDGRSLDVPYDIQVAGDYHTNLTVNNFSVATNMIELLCSGGTISEMFLFGIPVPPTLSMMITDEVNVTENTDVYINMTDPKALAAFPPQVMWRVARDGGPLDEANIMINDYVFEVTAINRNQSGLYNISAFNDAGNADTSFVLNVQYAPEAKAVSVILYALIGENITLTAFTDVLGNPMPSAVWRDHSNATVPLQGRYSAPKSGQLRIENITAGDFGKYNCILKNEIGSIMNEVELKLATPPGPPLMLQYSNLNITNLSVELQWQEPTDLGGPMLMYYKVHFSPSVTTGLTNDTALKISGLKADTIYNASVVAISSKFPNGGDSSNTIQFKIDYEEPVFKSNQATAMNGGIVVTWKLKHTGGFDRSLFSVKVQCYRSDEISSGSGEDIDTDLTFMCNNCINEDLAGTAHVGPVYAGIVYDCGITIYNDLYSIQDDLHSIEVEQGIPSSPIINAKPGYGMLTLILLTEHPGVLESEEAFKFIVTVTEISGGIVLKQNVDVDNVGNRPIMTSTNIQLSAGEYYVTAIANNIYGDSDASNEMKVTISPSIPDVSTTSEQPSPSTIPTEKANNVGAIVGGVVGGVVLLLLVAILIAVMVYFYMKRKKKGHYIYYRPTEQKELGNVATYRDAFD